MMNHQKGEKTTCIKIFSVFLFVFVFVYRWLWFCWIVSRLLFSDCGGGADTHSRDSKGRALRGNGLLQPRQQRKPSLCSVSCPALPTDPPVAVMRQPYQNIWPGGGRGDRNPTVPTMWPSIFFSPVSQLSWLKNSCLRIFCSIWVGSKCLSKSRVEAPSRAAQFDLLVLKSQRDISVHLESSISQQRHTRYLIKTEMNTVHMCKY